MLGSLQGLQQQQQNQNIQQQQQQQQQQQGNPNQNIPPPPPPPPLNGQDLNLSNILHFLQSEWRRYERERNEWEIERAEMRARIALLEGERRSFENTRIDLMRRIKMLEFALRMERSKQLIQAPAASMQPSKSNALQSQSNALSQKDETGSHKEGSTGSSPRSEDVPLPPENRISITSLSALPNGTSVGGQSSRPHTWAGSNWQGAPNGVAPMGALGKPPPGRDPKSRARSRDYLKQCLQEISYLTSPQAMNPLPNRPLLNPALPLVPNVPAFEQIAYNGRPRKLVPDVGKEFPSINGLNLMSTGGPSNAPPAGGSQMPMIERDARMNSTGVISLHQPHPGQQPGPGQAGGFHMQPSPIGQSTSSGQPPQMGKDKDGDELPEPQLSTAIYRPDSAGEWKEMLRMSNEAAERARLERLSQSSRVLETSSWDSQTSEEEEVKEEDPEVEDEEAGIIGENDGKVWKPRRTLRNHLDAVRALAFHPTEMCLATGSDDCTVKIWRMDVAGLASTVTRATTEVEPQLTLRGHTSAITRLVHSPSKRVLFSASLDSSIRVWALPSPSHTTYAPYDSTRARGELVGHTDAVWDLALLRDETMLVSCGSDGTVKVWDVSGPPGHAALKLSWGYAGLDADEEEGSSPQETPGATALEAIKSDLKKVAVAYQNGLIKLFDIDSGKELSRLQGDSSQDGAPPSQANAVVSHPTMPILVTGHEDKHIRLFDIVTGQCTHSMVAHLDAVTSLSLDVAGFSLVSGSHDCSVRFWDLLGTRACIQEITSHREKAQEGVLDVEFHPSLPFMASAGADGVVKLYASSS
ncbi:WD40 repeat-like protein [Rickenella mellea]|uniref:WD40 repeat-like protein n=1 Tax=Rickenella mellea TaxID=50990 RepID=A0A4Y7QJE5_9AGAM|nr:WD40 repeat-like protein [Rickenella mellea]